MSGAAIAIAIGSYLIGMSTGIAIIRHMRRREP